MKNKQLQIIHAYRATVKNNGMTLHCILALEKTNPPLEDIEESVFDDKIYYFLTQEEVDNLKVGMELDKGTFITAIDKEYEVWQALV